MYVCCFQVLVTGIGSDAAQFAMQIASLSGSSLYATSRSDHKIHLGKQKLGVTGGVNTKNTVVTGKLKSFTAYCKNVARTVWRDSRHNTHNTQHPSRE